MNENERGGFAVPKLATASSWDSGDTPSPWSALTRAWGRPLRVAILSDFVSVPYANGAIFQTRFLYQELVRAGHSVTIVGPHDPDASPGDLAPGTIALPSVAVRSYPGLHMPLPLASWVFDPDRWDFDIVFGQTTSLLLDLGVWLRRAKGIPFVSVNTTHLTAAYDALLPEAMSRIGAVHQAIHFAFERPCLRLFSDVYNGGDGLVVLSEGLGRHWREQGVNVPIHVVPRAVPTEIFDAPLGPDPYPRGGGPRLLAAGRLLREKSQDRLIRIFARHILPRSPEATLTLVGDGPDAAAYRRLVAELGVTDRVRFTGEVSFARMRDHYGHADLFVHGSLTETYGNVLGEALWCGLPTVAFADDMGASSQVQNEINGVLIPPGHNGDRAVADAEFGKAVVRLLGSPEQRDRLGARAAQLQRERSSPAAVTARLAQVFVAARERVRRFPPRPVGPLTAVPHFHRWLLANGGVWLAGFLRRGNDQVGARPRQPQLGA